MSNTNDLAVRRENAIKRAKEILIPITEDGHRYIIEDSNIYNNEERQDERIVVNVKFNLRMRPPNGDISFNQRLKERIEFNTNEMLDYIQQKLSINDGKILGVIQNYITMNYNELWDIFVDISQQNLLASINCNRDNQYHQKILDNNRYGFVGRNNGYFSIDTIDNLLNLILNLEENYDNIKRLKGLGYNITKIQGIAYTKIIKKLEEEVAYFDYFINFIINAFESLHFGDFVVDNVKQKYEL